MTVDNNKTLKLQDLLQYDSIVVQCHNVPDADALASGFALVRYFQSQGRDLPFVYGGREEISKPNLLLMIRKLHIPVHHVSEIEEPDLLITVDSQYGQSNIQKFPAKELCVIDHHEVDDRTVLPPLSEVMENYGSCATVLYGLLKNAGYDLQSDKSLQTALYYGLYTDTGKFQELWHPVDKDMWDELSPDEGILDELKYTNIASSDLAIIGAAFSSHEINEKYRYGIVQVKTGDPNILGIVSDTFLEVDSIDTCIAYAFLVNGVKLSVRSCKAETRADELSKVLVQEIGNAGGHVGKAGGFVPKDNITTCYSDWEEFWKSLLHSRLQNYFDNTDVVRAGDVIDLTGYEIYRKMPVTVGVADLNTVFDAGEKVRVRTLEGDIDVTVAPDQYLMIGVNEEIYPVKKATFDKNYRLTGGEYQFQTEYIPALRSCRDGRQVSLEGITAECEALGSSLVYAKRLNRRTHVFTTWDPQNYISGKEGDWIAVQKDDLNDVYIIAEKIFSQTYRPEGDAEK